jgi:glyoxylase I family protein
MGLKAHHTGVLTANVEASLRFYHDGLGLDLLSDVSDVTGDWPSVFGLGSRRARTISLGDALDRSAGVIELIVFEDFDPAPPSPVADARGLLLVSFMDMDVDAALDRLGRLGFRPVGRIEARTATAKVDVATIRDPNGVLVELVGPAQPL